MEFFKEWIVILVAAPLYAVIIIVEIVLSQVSNRGLYSRRGVLENVWLSLLNMGLDILIRGTALVVLAFSHQYRIVEIEYSWLYWIALLLAEDFTYYWLHRVDHHCRLFWAVHVTHHSSEEFNLTVGFRSSVFQPLYRFVYFIPLAFLGFRSMDIFLMYSATQIYGILIHTQLITQLGWLEYVLVTPSHHRVHHGSNVEYLDKNLGMVFIFWDKLFGTFTPEMKTVRYGLTENLNAPHLLHLVFHEWRSIWEDVKKASRWRDKIRYVLGPPGWSHDSSKKTSKQLQLDASSKKMGSGILFLEPSPTKIEKPIAFTETPPLSASERGWG